MKYSATFLPLLALVALLAPHVMAGAEDGGSVQKPGYLGDKDGGYYDGDKDKHYDHKDYDKNYDHKDDDKKDYDRKDNDKDYDHKDYDHKDYDHKDYDAHDSGYSGEHGHDKYKTQVLWGQCMLRLLCSIIDDH